MRTSASKAIMDATGEKSERRQLTQWDAIKLRRFKRAVESAKSIGKRDFMFDGFEFDVGHAGYLVEFLELKFANDQRLYKAIFGG
jgi:hypothetical protein